MGRPQPAFSLTFPLARVTVLGFSLSGTRLTILLAATGAIAGFHVFLRRTPLGRAVRAVAQNYTGAVILGVNPRWVSRAIYLAGIVATAGAGVLLALAIPLEPYSGVRLTLVAMTIVVIGGVGSLPGALLGGGLLGIAEVLTAYAFGSIWAPVVSLVVFFAVLVIRPEGLWGRRPSLMRIAAGRRPGGGGRDPGRRHARPGDGDVLHLPLPGARAELRHPRRVPRLHEPGAGGLLRARRVRDGAPAQRRAGWTASGPPTSRRRS